MYIKYLFQFIYNFPYFSRDDIFGPPHVFMNFITDDIERSFVAADISRWIGAYQI